jgi:hypothetical protein
MFIRPGATSEERDVLRLWRSGRDIAGGNGEASEASTPVGIGSLTHERMKAPSWPLTSCVTTSPSGLKSNAPLAVPTAYATSTVERGCCC